MLNRDYNISILEPEKFRSKVRGKEPKSMKQRVKLRDRIRRISMISTLYAIGLVEAYYLPRYGIQWLLAGLMATVLLASFWIRSRWN